MIRPPNLSRSSDAPKTATERGCRISRTERRGGCAFTLPPGIGRRPRQSGSAVTVMRREGVRHRTPFAERQPQPDHVAPALRFGIILEPGAGMQDRVVVTELHVADLQIHIEMDARVVGKAIQEIERRRFQRFERLAGSSRTRR